MAAVICTAPIFAIAAGADAASAAALPSSSHVTSALSHDSKGLGDRCFYGDGRGWGDRGGGGYGGGDHGGGGYGY
ncbi:hypothetical protein [Streptomyces sp. NPDC002265]|uniref:hypothetical protein n=1 Tax=Streptomyces sp. NPDC002265 TaxID=3154415 RepID=UPI003329ED91